MRRKLLQTIVSVVAGLLCMSVMTGTAALATQDERTYDPFDYGDGRTEINESISASELFGMALGMAPSAAEEDYLKTLSGITLRYNAAIPTQNISTSYQREDGTLDVTVQPYSYTAKNGVTVEWIPQSATLEGDTKMLDTAFFCRFEGLSQHETADLQMEVTFYTVITLPNAALSLLANDAYFAGAAALEQLDAYAAEYRAWEQARERYLAYAAYLEAIERFEDYQAAMLVYDTEYAVYLQYCNDYEQYQTTLQLYEDWRHYYAYQKFLEEGVDRYRLYLEYRSQVDKILAKLDVLEKLFVSDSNHWQLYDSLMGGTVTEVVNRREELIAAGCNANDIHAAGEATEAIRPLMKGYSRLRKAEYASEHERITALYDYYTQNYIGLRDGYTRLYGALISLYDNSLVVSALELEGKLLHFQQFVGQLYYTATVLDDNVKTTESWTISKKPLTEVVEECHRVSDTNTANPAGVLMPPTEVEAVQPVDPIDEPTQPDPIVKPKEPTEVAEPKKPEPVDDPSLSTIPPVAADPGAAPKAPSLDPCLLRLAEEIRAGGLTERTPTDGCAVTLYAGCTRPVSIDNKKVITFYDADRKTVLYQTTVEHGSPIVYLGPDIQSKQDERYYYSFYRWELADHTPAQMIADADLSLYAKYWQRDRFYTVTWILDGISYSEQYLWGQTPISPFSHEKNESEGYTYRFSGWRSDAFEEEGIFAVCGDVTYVASFEAIPKCFTVTWVFSFGNGQDLALEEQYSYLEYPRFSGNTAYADSFYRYILKGWQEVLQPVRENVTYHANLERTALAVADDGTLMEITHTDAAIQVTCSADRIDLREAALYAHAEGKDLVLVWDSFTVTVSDEALEQLVNSGCRKIGVTREALAVAGEGYRIGYYNSLNYLIDPTFSVCIKSADGDGDGTSLYILNGDAWSKVGSDGIERRGTVVLRIVGIYSIFVGSAENCDLSQLTTYADAGSLVDLRISCKFGYEVSGATVRLADGTIVEVNDLCFVMPDCAVTVDLQVTRIVYRISFVADGMVLFEREYFLGEQILVPEAPTKASDGVYDYTFGGWSKNVTVAYGDERTQVIEAIFIATEIPEKDPYKSLYNNNLFLTVILPIVLGVIALAVGLLIFFKKRKKRKLFTDAQRLRTETAAPANLNRETKSGTPSDRQN